MRAPALALVCALLLGCSSGGAPPRQLAGMWSAGPAACSARIGLEFGAEAIEAIYVDEREALVERPRYEVIQDEPFRVRIRYRLPGNAAVRRSGEGIIDLERIRDGSLRPVAHRFENELTGAVRLSIGADPMVQAMTVRPCDQNAWIGDLRGRRRT